MANPSVGRAILPVGFPIGTSHPLGVNHAIERPCEIRLGQAFVNVSPAHYTGWMAALEALDRPRLLEEWAGEGVPQPELVLKDLFEAGLLVELEDAPLDNLPTLERFRLYPTGYGSGNSLESQLVFELGATDPESRAKVDVRVYSVWALSTWPISIAEACRSIAKENDADPTSFLGQLALSLPLLVRSGAAFLDLAPGSEAPG
jgi:hypothetical protein